MSNIENKTYSEKKKIAKFKKDLKILGKFSKIISLEIEFDFLDNQALFFPNKFDDHFLGTFTQNSIFVQMMDQRLDPINNLLDLINTTIIDEQEIESLMVHCELEFLDKPVEVSIELTGENNPPKILSVSDMYHYYEISKLIQAKFYLISKIEK